MGVDIDKIYFEPGILDDELGLIRRLLATRLFPGGSKGTGQLVELSFKTIGIGTSELELKNAQLGAPNGQILAPQISSSIITITYLNRTLPMIRDDIKTTVHAIADPKSVSFRIIRQGIPTTGAERRIFMRE